MSTIQFKSKPHRMLNLDELSLDLARLDLTRIPQLGEAVVDLLTQYFQTDRVSLVLYNEKEQRIARAFVRGFDAPLAEWADNSEIIQRVCETREPLLVRDEHAFVSETTHQRYRTNAFAVYPLIFQGRLLGVLCLSNLCTQQLEQMLEQAREMQCALAQIAQICKLLVQPKPVAGKRKLDEVELVSTLLERLEDSTEPRSAYSVFSEILCELLPVQALAIIHDRVNEPQLGVVCVHKPVHASELDRLFENIANQWQRRHKHGQKLAMKDAQVIGEELIRADDVCPAELRLPATQVFPVFLDNDLFAIVCLAADSEALEDRRFVSLFSLMSRQLFTFMKKRMLLTLNSAMQTHDSLTGLINEKQFYQMLEREFDRAKRYSVPLSILFVDIDHFKDINESYGFETGDQVLRELSRIIRENMRTTDFASRYSGERFVVVLPETPNNNSEAMANRLRRYIENHSFYIPNTNVFVKVTASVGVASFLDHKPASVAQFIEYADTALYFAKRNGRNQVVGYSYVINLMVGETRHKG